MIVVLVLTGWILLFSGCTKDSEVPVSGKFVDSRDQREYQWVIVGTQTWMAENLAWLPAVDSSIADCDTTPYYYVFNYEGTNITEAKAWKYYSDFGVFYNWPAAMNGAGTSAGTPGGIQGVCPEGWHLPSDEEWDILVVFLGGEYTAGKEMKSTKGWNNYEGVSGKGNNSSGFNALAAGERRNGGGFFELGYCALFWSSTNYGEYSAWYRNLWYNHIGVNRYMSNKRYGFSVRCVRNSLPE